MPNSLKAVVTIDEEGLIVSANSVALSMFGYSFSELVGKNVKLLMPSPYAEQHDSYIKRFLATRTPKVMDTSRLVSAKHKTGRHIPLKLSLSVMRLPSGKFMFIGLLEPVASRTVKVKTDAKCDIISVSNNVENILGYRKRELIGKNVSLLTPEPHASLHDSYLERYRLSGVSRVLGLARNLDARHRDGHTFAISLQVVKTNDGFKARLIPLDKVEVMITVTAAGYVEKVSASSRILFGRTEEEFQGVLFDSLFIDLLPSKLELDTVFEGTARALDGASVQVAIERNVIHESTNVRFRVTSADCMSSSPRSFSGSESEPDSSVEELGAAGTSLGMYELAGVLGEGYFGSVRKATHKLSGLAVAVKKLSAKHFHQIGMAFPPLEVRLLRTLAPHQNVMQLYDVIETSSRVFMIQEYVPGQELYEMVFEEGPLPYTKLQLIFRQIVQGLTWLHKFSIVHRDLKLENCLVTPDMKVKIIDLGLGTFYEKNHTTLRTFCGSPDYGAPELYMRKDYMGPPVDIWAFGVMLYIAATTFVPFQSPQDVVDVQYSWPSKNTVNINVKDVVRRIFQFKPSRRMFLEELRAHPFIDLPPEEISTVDATVDDELVDALCAQQGLDRDFVLSSLQPHDGKLPCNGVYTSYQMLLMKKMTKKNEVSEL